ncbi:MAG TPA: hypothetical protein VLV83_12185 [Acidobacteriota bacterium]|nr:hypothetical protein [Acidobacteriota bacterium]
MVRTVIAVLVGYFVMALLVFILLSGAWLVVGSDFAFQPGTTKVTMGWIALNLPLSFIAALAGGCTAAYIGRRPAAVRALAYLVLAVGLIFAVLHLAADDPSGREAATDGATVQMSSFEAASEAVQPIWYNFLIPFVGAAGVLLGGRAANKTAD